MTLPTDVPTRAQVERLPAAREPGSGTVAAILPDRPSVKDGA